MCQEQGPRSAAGTRRALSRADPGGCCGRGLLLPPSPHSAPVPPVPPPPGGESRLPRPIKGGRGPAVLAAERGPIPASGRALSLGHAGKSGDGAAAPLPEPGASSVRAQGVLLLPRAQGIPPLPRAQRVLPIAPGTARSPCPGLSASFSPQAPPGESRIPHPVAAMASVPSAGCLLAKNQYYRSECSAGPGAACCPQKHPLPFSPLFLSLCFGSASGGGGLSSSDPLPRKWPGCWYPGRVSESVTGDVWMSWRQRVVFS